MVDEIIKFWANDFGYTERLGCVEPFGYLFSVCGESANYLTNKYELRYPNVFVNCYLDKTIYIGSRTNKTLQGKQCGETCCCDEDDIEELYNLLKPIMECDMQNYKSYKDKSWFTSRPRNHRTRSCRRCATAAMPTASICSSPATAPRRATTRRRPRACSKRAC